MAIPLFDMDNPLHFDIAMKSKNIHSAVKKDDSDSSIAILENELDSLVIQLFS